MEALAERNRELEARLAQSIQENAELEGQVTSLTVDLEAKDRRIAVLEGQVTSLAVDLEEKDRRIAVLEAKLEAERRNSDLITLAREARVKAAREEYDRRVAVLEGEVTELRKRLRDEEHTVVELRYANTALEGEVTELRKRLGDEEHTVIALEATLAERIRKHAERIRELEVLLTQPQYRVHEAYNRLKQAARTGCDQVATLLASDGCTSTNIRDENSNWILTAAVKRQLHVTMGNIQEVFPVAAP